MSIGATRAVAVVGIEGQPIDVETHVSNGLPAHVVIGLPDAALAQSTHRVRSAFLNSDLDLPKTRVTTNLSPADVPKHGSGFDLAIAASMLAAEGIVEPQAVRDVAHIGELALDGRLRPVRGVLPAVLAAKARGDRCVIVPSGNLAEASLVPGVRIVGLPSLREVAIWHGAELDPVPVEVIEGQAAAGAASAEPDLADVIGNEDEIEALQVAAAGGHHLFFLGPPGAGKTMLAARLPGILPDLSLDESLEVTSIRSLDTACSALETRPPFEAPHHSATMASIIGGGSSRIRPGAAVRASRGVLFLDEAPEFPAAVLDSLRQPLESGRVTIHRAAGVATFPAVFQLVLAANPCPCGFAGVRGSECTCTPHARNRYLGRLSGPLLDRIDMQLQVQRVSVVRMHDRHAKPPLTSAQARKRVENAIGAAKERWREYGWQRNAHASGAVLKSARFELPPAVRAPIDRALHHGAISMRGYDRILRVAHTLADLGGRTVPDSDDIGRAVFWRRTK